MKKFIKHTLILLSLMVSTYQAMHVVGHLLNSHDDNTKDLIQVADHKCSLCHISINSLLPDNEFEPFIWKEGSKYFVQFRTPTATSEEVAITYFSLRAPPVQL